MLELKETGLILAFWSCFTSHPSGCGGVLTVGFHRDCLRRVTAAARQKESIVAVLDNACVTVRLSSIPEAALFAHCRFWTDVNTGHVEQHRAD